VEGFLACPFCSHREKPGLNPAFCPRCGVPLRWEKEFPRVFPSDLRGRGVWRYRPLLPDVEPVTLGEGGTPLLSGKRGSSGIKIFWKLEFLNPTGSFKDRGATVMVSVLRSLGAKRLADDSSGNAGAALAAYAAAAGLPAKLFVPAYASGPKVRQIEAYGAELVRVPGTRPEAALAARKACTEEDLVYASHNLSPYFVVGLTTLAFEIAEDLGWVAPDHLVVPVGGGGLFLGLFYGFSLLVRLGWVEKIPKIHVAQPEACAPIVLAWEKGAAEPVEVEPKETLAEGTRIPRPERGREVLWALRAAGGEAVSITEEEIRRAQKELAQEGLYVEPTAALGPAAVPKLLARGLLSPGQTVVVPLTGFGLKAS